MIKQHDHYDIHYEYGTIFALPPTPAWIIQLMADAKEADIQSWTLLNIAVDIGQIDTDQGLYAAILMATRLQQIH